MVGQICHYIICTMSMAHYYDAGISYLVETGVLIKASNAELLLWCVPSNRSGLPFVSYSSY